LGWAGERNLATCGMVRVEVLRGIISPKVHHKTTIFLDAMINVPSNARLWNAAADLAWQLDRQGIVIPGTDLVIAACALRIGAAVLTSDLHFSRIDGLEVIAPPTEWAVG
jgi:predicted nucleic acid-binding protein